MKINHKTVSGLLVMAIAVFFFYITYSFPNPPSQDTGPAFMPRIYSGILMFLGLLLFISSFKEEKAKQENNSNLVFIMMGVLLLYIFLIPIIGFYLITPIYLFVFLWIVDVRRIIPLVSVPILTTALIFLFFQEILNVPIPMGLLS